LAADEAVLATLQPRKDIRKARGLVKLTPGVVETRKAAVELPWTPEKNSGDNDEEAEEKDDGEAAEDVEMDEEESETLEEASDEVEEEPEPSTALSGKQKRKRAAEQAPTPRKKVSFGADPKTSKQARSAGSLVQKPASAAAAAKEKRSLKTAPAPKTDVRKVANTAVKTKASQKMAATAGSTPGQEYNFGEFF
jgi:nuclear GTP-binding protein